MSKRRGTWRGASLPMVVVGCLAVLGWGNCSAATALVATPSSGVGGAEPSVGSTPLSAATATPTCSCSATCRCPSDQPYGVGAYRARTPPPNLAETEANVGQSLFPGAAPLPFVATGVFHEFSDGTCPQDFQPTATAPPGGAWNLVQLGAREAWSALGWAQIPLQQHRVYVAVVDTGLDTSHPDLRDRIAPWRKNFAGLEPTSDVSADSAHGTAMSSIVAALGDNGDQGIDGLMWGVQVIPCKVGGGSNGTLAKAVQCVEWLARLADEQHVRIAAVNFSFGSECCDCALERAVAGLRDRGILFLASAGNGRKNSDASDACPFYPASYPLSNVVAVTGADPYGNVLYRYGRRRVHVAAPGVAIPVLTPGGGWSVMPGGSSPAAAHATGVVALLYAQDPTRSWMEVRNLLLSSGPEVACGQQPTCALITGRRIQAWGSEGHGALSCSGQVVVRRLLPVDDTLTGQPGDTVVFRVLSIQCALPQPLPAIAVRRASPAGGTVSWLRFRDDGVAPDQVAHDGEFHATWTIPAPPGRDYAVTIAGETLQIHVVPPGGP